MCGIHSKENCCKIYSMKAGTLHLKRSKNLPPILS